MLPDKALAIAREQAERDRDTLARFVREGKVMQVSETALTRDMGRRRGAQINLALRPKSKRRRR